MDHYRSIHKDEDDDDDDDDDNDNKEKGYENDFYFVQNNNNYYNHQYNKDNDDDDDDENEDYDNLPMYTPTATTTTTTTTTTSSSSSTANSILGKRLRDNDEQVVMDNNNISASDSSTSSNKKIKISVHIENPGLQAAISEFKHTADIEIGRLCRDGLSMKSAVQQLVVKIQDSSISAVHPSTITSSSSSPTSGTPSVAPQSAKDLKLVMDLCGFTKEEATRILVLKNEIVSLKNHGFDQASAIHELSKRLKNDRVASI
ncbi:hypothetical protein SAMD00019534_088710, partial [Acytostelium subglobosum LB1]|uniref:hypothetical protein n=1 Tax=Acytostelium subglobosum LB1 TaxID=1410327 RepID=UPI00064491AC